jgi:predicted transposase YbfD/YdcC
MTFSDDYSAYSSQFSSIFSQLKDPRRTGKGNIKYPLTEILFLAVSSVLCGYTDFVCIEEFGELNLAWLRKYYPYSNGTCSHDVIGKLFQRLNYQQFSECFMQWARLSYKFNTEELIAIDGKRVCGSYDTASATPASHIVSAYASAGEICIGQVVTEEKSNEITAIPELLDSIDLRSAIVSIDAMGCQRDIAEKIISKKADYILAVKANQKYLYDDVVDLFASKQPFKSHSAVETGHGRIEKRTATVLDSAVMLDDSNKWPGLRSLVKIDTERYIKSTRLTSTETRYYISSCTGFSAEKMNQLVRQHWSVENKLHWQLDVNFGEDDARKRVGNAANNFNLILKTALALLQRDKTNKLSVKRKGMRASFDIKYREQLMKV